MTAAAAKAPAASAAPEARIQRIRLDEVPTLGRNDAKLMPFVPIIRELEADEALRINMPTPAEATKFAAAIRLFFRRREIRLKTRVTTQAVYIWRASEKAKRGRPRKDDGAE